MGVLILISVLILSFEMQHEGYVLLGSLRV